MKVYVVLTDSCHGTEIYKICAKEEKAQEYCDFLNDNCRDDVFCYYLEQELEDD